MKDTVTTWTCDRCGLTATTNLQPPAPNTMGMGMTPPMPMGWREFTPLTEAVLLCGVCCTDFANWVAHPASPPLQKGAK